MASEILTWTDENGGIHVVDVDMVTGADDDRTAEVTSFPVEKGADINDHIIQQPDKLSIEIAHTQSPFPSPTGPGMHYAAPKGFAQKTITLDVRKSQFKPGGLLALTEAVGGLIDAGLQAIGLSSPQSDEVKVGVYAAEVPVDRIGELHDQLINIKTKGYFCTVTFRGRVYPDFIMTRVNWSSTKGETGLGRFKCDLQSVRIVENAVAELPDPASLRLIPKTQQTKTPKVSTDPGASKAKFKSNQESLASRILGGAGASSS